MPMIITRNHRYKSPSVAWTVSSTVMNDRPFIKSTYCMYAEKPWRTYADEDSLGNIERFSEQAFDTYQNQETYGDPMQMRHQLPLPVPKHHITQQTSASGAPIASFYVGDTPAYNNNYCIGNDPINISKDEVYTTSISAQSRNFQQYEQGRTWAASAYAWQHHDDVPDLEDTIRLDFEDRQGLSVTSSNAVLPELPNPVEETESLPAPYFTSGHSSHVHCSPNTRKYVSSKESKYLGMPNDLYLVCSNFPTSSLPEITVPNAKCETQTVYASPVKVDQQPFGTAHEDINPNDLPGPAHFPVAHYATQYSPLGEAFTPVRLSTYQQEELNDLASCIDVM